MWKTLLDLILPWQFRPYVVVSTIYDKNKVPTERVISRHFSLRKAIEEARLQETIGDVIIHVAYQWGKDNFTKVPMHDDEEGK